MDNETLFELIDKNRNAFTAYNIARLRELLRYLPESKLDVFQTIPFLLHVNSKDFPGYVESSTSAFGIFRFHQSGFFKYAAKKYELTSSVLAAISPANPVILGLYLMGSAGTLTQTEKSDFDYWVITDKRSASPSSIEALKKKVARIESWCKKNHQQDVTFFVMDIEEIRLNHFPAVDEESSGSAQETLLKDEFYRTFIMIAGKIPFWAVLPVGISDDDYSALVTAVKKKVSDEYIDTGNLTHIDSGECLGAVLWQVYKARNDPVKALIKSSLAACYFFSQPNTEMLISDMIKARFSESRIDDHGLDPYTFVFHRIIEFYKDMDDSSGLALVRQCIILRLCSYPLITVPDRSSPKGRLMTKLISDWEMAPKLTQKLHEFHTWPEYRKLEFEDRVFEKLSFLYELILRSNDEETASINMSKEDLETLKNRTAAFIQKKPCKLLKSSTYLRKKSSRIELTFRDNSQLPHQSNWAVYPGVVSKKENGELPVFIGPELLKIIGWALANQLAKDSFSRITINMGRNHKKYTHPETALKEIEAFFKGFFPRPDHVFTTRPMPEKMVIVLKSEHPENDDISAIDCLFANSWGEFFFDSKDLSFIESTEQKCYKIAELIFQHMDKNGPSQFRYLVCQPAEKQNTSILTSVNRFINTLKTKAIDLCNADKKERPKPKKPFLDLL